MNKINTIEEFDDLHDLPGGSNILAAGKNTPIWQQATSNKLTDYYKMLSAKLSGPPIGQKADEPHQQNK